MKTHIFMLTLGCACIICCFYTSLGQSLTWQTVPSLEGPTLTNYTSNDSVIIANSLSGLFRSTDNGVSWNQIPISSLPCNSGRLLRTSSSLLFFANFQLRDSVYRSTDNGRTWQGFAKNQTSTVTLHKGILYASAGSNRIDYSIDDGRTWRILTSLPISTIQRIVSFNDRLLAICINERFSTVILQSFDQQQWSLLTDTFGEQRITEFICDVSGQFYAHIQSKGYYTSKDTGKTWTSINSNLPDSVTKLVSQGSLVKFGESIFTTTINGVYKYSPQNNQWLQLGDESLRFASSIAVLDNGTFFVSTIRGTFRSTDTGKTWQSVYSGLKILSNPILKSINNKLFLNSSEHFWLQMSLNNGQTWSDTRWITQGVGNLDNYAVLGQTIIGISSLGGYVSVSNDNGATWRLVIDQVQNIYSARSLVAHNNRLFAIGSSDRLYQSSDTGRTWFINRAIPGLDIYTIKSIDNQLFVSAESGFLRSQDTGKTWETISRDVFFDIDVLNNQTYIGRLLRQSPDPLVSNYRITRNSGMSWENLSIPQGETILQRVVFFRNSVIAQFGNSLHISQDLARTWKKITNIGLTNENISGLTVHNSLLFASFSCSGLYRTDLTTVSTREEPQNTLFISSPAPNPSTDYTDLAFTLPRAAQAGVTLYSTLGTEVWRSESGMFPAGEQHIRIDTRHLPTGVYAYRLVVDGVSSVGRVVVVR